LHNFTNFPLESLCILTIDKFPILWYNIYVVKRGTLAENGVRNTDEESRNLNAQKDNRHKRPHLQVSGIRKIVANIFRKPLDKTYIIWYNIYSEREVNTYVHLFSNPIF
jgi:hypothetical protein